MVFLCSADFWHYLVATDPICETTPFIALPPSTPVPLSNLPLFPLPGSLRDRRFEPVIWLISFPTRFDEGLLPLSLEAPFGLSVLPLLDRAPLPADFLSPRPHFEA